MKRIIIIAFLITITSIIGVSIYLQLNKFPKEELSREKAIALMNKAGEYDNIYIKTHSESENNYVVENREHYRKGNIEFYTEESKYQSIATWINKDSKETIIIDRKNKAYWIYYDYKRETIELTDSNFSYKFIRI